MNILRHEAERSRGRERGGVMVETAASVGWEGRRYWRTLQPLSATPAPAAAQTQAQGLPQISLISLRPPRPWPAAGPDTATSTTAAATSATAANDIVGALLAVGSEAAAHQYYPGAAPLPAEEVAAEDAAAARRSLAAAATAAAAAAAGDAGARPPPPSLPPSSTSSASSASVAQAPPPPPPPPAGPPPAAVHGPDVYDFVELLHETNVAYSFAFRDFALHALLDCEDAGTAPLSPVPSTVCVCARVCDLLLSPRFLPLFPGAVRRGVVRADGSWLAATASQAVASSTVRGGASINQSMH